MTQFKQRFQTEHIDGEIESADNGFDVFETFELHGELIERETDLKFNDDGSVTLTQKDQMVEVVTLSEPVVERLCHEVKARE